MSDAGLFSSVYQQIREYADILDRVLIELKDGSSQHTDENRQWLGRLFVDLANENYDDTSTRLVVLMLQGRVGIVESELRKVGEGLLSSTDVASLITPLEQFAQCLEQEQIRALARIRS